MLLARLMRVLAYVARVVVAPVRRVIEACVALGAGERTVLVPEGALEFRALSDAFDEMAARLEQRRVALAEAEERQRLLLASLPGTVVAIYDRELSCRLLDGPVLREGGIDSADLIGRSLYETLPAEQAEQLDPCIRRALDGEAASLRHTSSLSGRTYEYDIAPLRLADDTIDAAFLVGRDITARLDSEQALRERERMFAGSQAVAHVGSWEWDVRCDRMVWSDELCRISGKPIGWSPTVSEFMAMVHPDDRDRLHARVEDVRDGTGSESEYRIVRPDGQIRHVRTSLLARLDETGGVVSVFGTAQDVTERVEHEREAERAREAALAQLAEAQRIAEIGSGPGISGPGSRSGLIRCTASSIATTTAGRYRRASSSTMCTPRIALTWLTSTRAREMARGSSRSTFGSSPRTEPSASSTRSATRTRLHQTCSAARCRM